MAEKLSNDKIQEIKKPSKDSEIEDIVKQINNIQKEINTTKYSDTKKLRELIDDRSRLEMKYNIYTGRQYF